MSTSPKDALAVEGPARTFNCAVVVPSMGELLISSATVDVGVDGATVCVTCGVDVGGSVAVKKSGVAAKPA
jgi:hypothetical protein